MDRAIKHLLEASVKLECTMETTARALVLYHHFNLCGSDGNYDGSMIAATALFLSGRLNEQVIDHETLLLTFYCIVNKTSRVLLLDDPEFQLIKRSLTFMECAMMRMLNFALDHKLAHQFLLPYLHTLFARSENVSQFSGEITNTSIRFISDFYIHKRSLFYHAHHITIACIDASLFIYGLLEDLEMMHPWYKGFCKKINQNKVKEIQELLFSLYKTEANKSSAKDIKRFLRMVLNIK